MIFTNEQIRQIAAAGGGLVIDASTITFTLMREISAAAAVGKASITIKNLTAMTPAQLIEIATLAPGLVVFDLIS